MAMAARRVVRIDAITPQFVEDHTGGRSLYCAVHRCFHDQHSFSGGSTGQRRLARRYCTACTAAQKRNFEAIANTVRASASALCLCPVLRLDLPRPRTHARVLCLCPCALTRCTQEHFVSQASLVCTPSSSTWEDEGGMVRPYGSEVLGLLVRVGTLAVNSVRG